MSGPAPRPSAGSGHPRAGAGSAPLRLAALEPYFGGSHRQFLLGLQRHSRHHIELFTLPPRLWKWRVRGSALQLARALNEAGEFDALLCSDFVNVADLRALLTPSLRAKPVLYYLHENQLSYPLSPEEELDPYFGFTNVLSCLSSEAVAFNSNFHCREFLARLPSFLPRLPDYDRRWVVTTIGSKSEVLPLGLDLQELERYRPDPEAQARTASRRSAPVSIGRPPRRILWNHRWEFDKDPERFFAALDKLVERKVPFRLDVVGESFARKPEVFEIARQKLGPRIGQFGYLESREEYIRLLWKSDIVVSTAKQEFFGIAMAEAVWCGAWPIAPRALVYEDLYGGAGEHLYRDDAELSRLLERALTADKLGPATQLRQRLATYDWREVAERFDQRFEALVAGAREAHGSR